MYPHFQVETSEPMSQRLLFCLTSNTISGANRILLELANRSNSSAYHSEVFFWNPVGKQSWFNKDIKLCEEPNLEKAVAGNFDFILFSNAFLLPLAIPAMRSAEPVLVCQGYEGFCHAKTFADTFTGSPVFAELYQLPVSKIAISKSVQQILAKLPTDSHYVPPAINELVFPSKPYRESTSKVKRVLAVGDYLWPLKGMSDLVAAMKKLSARMKVELVLITQQKRGREFFDGCSFPVEIHFQPEQNSVAEIYSSCHAYCCASWYEGFGLPCLEAFATGLPVVCTDNMGISDFGVNEVNVLLAAPDNIESLSTKLERILTDETLRAKLTTHGRATLEGYGWERTMQAFENCLEECKGQSRIKEISREKLERLSAELEQEGFYTPLAKHEKLVQLSEQLEQTLKSLERCTDTSFRTANLSRLDSIKISLSQELHNNKSELFQQFKARFDLCQIVLSLDNDPNFDNLVQSLNQRRKRAKANAQES